MTLVFYLPSRLHALNNGPFHSLSAYLAEITENSTYTSAATNSAQFMLSQLVQNNLAISSVTADSCETDASLTTDAQGTLIEGLSVLANVTGNADWQNQYAPYIIT